MTQFNDSLDDLIFGAGEVRTAPVRATAVEYKTAEQRFEENCPKCRGTGKFVGYSGRVFGQCFTCKGKGKFQFKTSPETRAANRQQVAARKDRVQQDAWQAFARAEGNQAVAEWIIANRPRFDFAAKMNEAVVRYGDLTEGQRAAVERCIARDAAKATERAERAQQAPQVDTAGIDRLKVAFDKAVAYAREKGLTMKTPKIVVDGIKIYPAGAQSKNPGAIYVKNDSTYLGKIAGGQFFAARECDDATKAKVLEFVADPAKAAVAYGQTTGVCCICSTTLISKWKHLGIGPICAQKMGWAGLAKDFGAI